MSENSVDVTQPLDLPCGVKVRNRVYKSALTEGLADLHNRATEQHETLYGLWSRGGFGIVATGNVQVDRRYLERAGNVAVDDNGGLDAAGPVCRGRHRQRHPPVDADRPRRPAGQPPDQPRAGRALGRRHGARGPAEGLRHPARAQRGRDPQRHPPLHARRRHRQVRRLHRRAAAQRPRLPAELLPVAPLQPPGRPLGRDAGKPRAPAARDPPPPCAAPSGRIFPSASS